MALVINNNLMALNAARNLTNSYGQLSVSTRRLSSGLRIGTAADDAAGLAIRELMRADISSLAQGVRNANDAISMIQVADGALQVIDEKLIRMKELAEQAATGTYTSDQRAIIDSEYQAMAAEIQRIAKATDFNGIKLLDGSLSSSIHNGSGLESTGKLKVHFGTGNNSAEDYYYIQIGEATADALSLGNGATFDTSMKKLAEKMQESFQAQFKPLLDEGKITQADYQALLDLGSKVSNEIKQFGDPQDRFWFEKSYNAIYVNEAKFKGHESYDKPDIPGANIEDRFAFYQKMDPHEKEKVMYLFAREAAFLHAENYAQWRDPVYSDEVYPRNGSVPPIPGGNAVTQEVLQGMLQGAISDACTWYLDRHDYAGMNIATQENAQISLEAINKAIVEKDKIRANLGAMQNRLENTITNLQIQAENLQAAESRISDADTALEMTRFVKNQILTQAATAMLAQANSLPQMALQLIQG